MSGINEEHPWLPADPGEGFDPLGHAGVHPSKETPMVVTPRGGAREVGRSCYQADTEHGTYLVDCGLNQGSGDDYPDFRGLDPGQIDAVFLTHAHVDHSGALPVLEARGLLDDDAVILATEPTVEIATMLLNDSLKIHRRETQQRGENQQFTQQDVSAVVDRFKTIGYGGGRVAGVVDVDDRESLVFQFGNAAHLLGSAWVALQTNGYRAVFSGDLGGRADHLPDITPPPEADLLLLESTYGGTHSHASMSDSRTALYNTVERAIEAREPVLIPTFAVGRAQLLQLLFTNRLHFLGDDLRDQVRVVIDGMAQEATETYHEYVTDEDYVAQSLVNAATESGRTQPFLPDGTVFPENDADRREVLEDADPSSGGKVPIVIAPSGMLTGGNSPRYLAEFAARFGSSKIILTGYQAVGTTGRQLQNQIKAGDDELDVETDATPFGTDWPDSENVVWTTVTDESGNRNRVSRATIPIGWIKQVDGLSGHAAQQGLREFCRSVGPQTVALIHGPDHAQDRLAKDLTQNVDAVEQTTRSRLLTPIPVTRDIDVDTPTLSESHFDSDMETYGEQIEHLHELTSAMNEEITAVRNKQLTEEDIRRIVRDELGD